MIEDESFPTVDPATGRKTEPPEEAESAIHLDAQHVLDMTEVVRQYVLTEAPIKALCHEDCPGLCPGCGSNLNKEKCKCNATPIDSPVGISSRDVD